MVVCSLNVPENYYSCVSYKDYEESLERYFILEDGIFTTGAAERKDDHPVGSCLLCSHYLKGALMNISNCLCVRAEKLTMENSIAGQWYLNPTERMFRVSGACCPLMRC